MLKRWAIKFLLILFSFSTVVWGRNAADQETWFSQSVGRKFYEIAYETTHSKDTGPAEVQQAIVFVTATSNLDSRAKYVLPEMIKLTSRYPNKEYSELVYSLLVEYVNESADLEVTGKAIRYLLNRLGSREQREQALASLLNDFGDKNMALNSELSLLLGVLAAEKTDTDNSVLLFLQAFKNNGYNKLAFEKLSEVAGDRILPAMRMDHLRFALGQNPLDMKNALAFAQYAEEVQLYQIAADAYQYYADLFGYLNSDQVLPASIYIPWMINCYNTQRNQHKCLQIAERLRRKGRFDLLAEAIAGKAARNIGKIEKANQIFSAAEDKALKLLANDSAPSPYNAVSAGKLAWFYCFALPKAEKALDWANKAYSIEPDSPSAAAILAYALVMNGQTDWAGKIIKGYQQDQIAAMVLAQIQLKNQEKALAFETLKVAIAKDPGSLEAERAKEILAGSGGEYIPPIDNELILATLNERFTQGIVPTFTRPEKIISVRLNVRGDKFYYGSEFGAAVAIKNTSSQPLIVSDDGLFKGNIRIDADITGDIKKKIPNLVSVKIRPSLPLEPGNSLLVPTQLVTGELRRILFTYPQASLDIEFTIYLDAVDDVDGKTVNRLKDIEPARLVIKRPRIELTRKYLQNRLNSISKGRQGQKIKSAQLFAGLLAEQQAMANRQPLYKFVYAEWMPDLLKSALVQNLGDKDWVVKIHTMAAMLPLPLDYEFTNAIAKNLNDTHWPTRMMATYLLAKNKDGGFTNVLDWTAKYDSSKLVRDMALALGAADPQIQEEKNRLSTNRPRRIKSGS